MNRNQFYEACKNSPFGLLIKIWNGYYPFDIKNGHIIVHAHKPYIFSGIGTLNQKEYSIYDEDGINHGKMASFSEAAGYVVCKNTVVCGTHCSSWVSQFNGSSPGEITYCPD